MSDLSSFKQYWKLPRNFLSGEPLPGDRRACGIVEDAGIGRGIRQLMVGEISIFCTTAWPSIPRGLLPLLDLRDTKTGKVVATFGKTLGGELYCPFDIQAVVKAFQLELYAQSTPDAVWLQHARHLYYRLRPLIPRAVQIRFRQLIAPLQSRRDFPDWPLDVSLDHFQRLLLRLMLQVSELDRVPFIWFWPEGYSNCVILTHDVETQVGHDNLWRIVNLERKYGFRSLWNFVPKRYDINAQIPTDLVADGFEIGVHGLYHDGRLFDSYAVFSKRAAQINRYLQTWGSEGFRAPSAVRNLEWIAAHIDVKYDTSCPTTEIHAPQPGGCCSVFPFMVGQMVELPFTMPQDHTLLTILKGEYDNIWSEVASQVLDQHGLVNIIVHPDYMLEPNDLAYYEAFLQWLRQRERNTWFALPREVAAWWRSRSQQQLYYGASGWKVDGPEAERTRIAHISVAGQDLLFEFE